VQILNNQGFSAARRLCPCAREAFAKANLRLLEEGFRKGKAVE
jgi:hypothetical protein